MQQFEVPSTWFGRGGAGCVIPEECAASSSGAEEHRKEGTTT
jgi:hypothetical protein